MVAAAAHLDGAAASDGGGGGDGGGGTTAVATATAMAGGGGAELGDLFAPDELVHQQVLHLGDDKDVVGAGCKWSLARFRQWFEAGGDAGEGEGEGGGEGGGEGATAAAARAARAEADCLGGSGRAAHRDPHSSADAACSARYERARAEEAEEEAAAAAGASASAGAGAGAGAGAQRPSSSCFELYGFDILVDADLRPGSSR